jgi:iron-regulated transporter 1
MGKGSMKVGMLALLAILACFEKVFSIINLICIEKDWVVIIAGEDEDSLFGM